MTPAELRRKPDHVLQSQRRFNAFDAVNARYSDERRATARKYVELIDAEMARRAKKREPSCSA